MIKFYFDSQAYLMDSSRHIRTHQKINPYNNTDITSFDEALTWARMYLNNELSARPIYFDLEIKKNDEDVNILNKEVEYTMILKESTGTITGEYEILITSETGSIKKKIIFIDGEAEFETHLEMEGIYEIELNEDFYIGSQKCIALIVTDNNVSYSTGKQEHKLIFEVK